MSRATVNRASRSTGDPAAASAQPGRPTTPVRRPPGPCLRLPAASGGNPGGGQDFRGCPGGGGHRPERDDSCAGCESGAGPFRQQRLHRRDPWRTAPASPGDRRARRRPAAAPDAGGTAARARCSTTDAVPQSTSRSPWRPRLATRSAARCPPAVSAVARHLIERQSARRAVTPASAPPGWRRALRTGRRSRSARRWPSVSARDRSAARQRDEVPDRRRVAEPSQSLRGGCARAPDHRSRAAAGAARERRRPATDLPSAPRPDAPSHRDRRARPHRLTGLARRFASAPRPRSAGRSTELAVRNAAAASATAARRASRAAAIARDRTAVRSSSSSVASSPAGIVLQASFVPRGSAIVGAPFCRTR